MLLNAVLPPGLALVVALAHAHASPNPVWVKHSTVARSGDSADDGLRVTAAAKRTQPVADAASSVTVITAEEIRAHGYRTLGETLRWVRGLFVTYDRHHAYVGVRGMQLPNDGNDKIVITVDGHTVNSDLDAEGWIGSELGVDMELVDRVEIVRGPMSALYGSGAALAVLNVVTRAAIQDPGVRMQASAGRHGERGAFASIAAASGGPQLLVGGSWQNTPGADLYFPEYDRPPLQSGWAIDADGERAWDALGSIEWYGLRIAAKLNEREKRLPTGSFGTTFGDRRTRTIEGRDFVEMSLTRRGRGPARPGRSRLLGRRSPSRRVRVRGARFDQRRARPCRRRAPRDRVARSLGAGRAPRRDRGVRGAVAAHVRARGARVHAGPAAERSAGAEAARRRVRRGRAAAGYQDQPHERRAARPRSRLRSRLQPARGLVVNAGDDTRWKLLAGSGYRAPSALESAIDPASPRPSLDPERSVCFEIAVEKSQGPATSTLAVYENHVRDLIELTGRTSDGLPTYANRGRVRGRGVEAEMETRGGGYQARFSTAWQVSRDLDTGAELPNSPRWIAQTVVTHALPGRPQSVALGLRYISSRSPWPASAPRRPGCSTDARRAR